MRMRTLAVAMAVVALAGCGQRPEQKKAAEDMKQGAQPVAQGAQKAAEGAQQGAQAGAQSLAEGLQQMANGLKAAQTGADGKPIQVVDFEKLIEILPSPEGWERSKPEGKQTSSPFSSSIAEARYTKGHFDVHVEITDSALNSMVMLPFTMMMSMNYQERSSSGYKKSVQYSKQPALEEWTADSKHGEVTIIVNKRFVVQCDGHGFDSMDVMKEVVDKIDINKLAALK